MNSADVFSPFGLLKQNLPFFSYREGQEEMAKKIEDAFSEKKGCIIEAGTGIGKSFAYLVPIFLLLKERPQEYVVIATSTITLQKQLYEKDIPLISKILSIDVEKSILYGRNNYICLRKYYNSGLGDTLFTLDNDSAEKKLQDWINTTKEGSKTDIKDKSVSLLAKDMFSDERDCYSSHCPYFSKCFFYNARQNAIKAHLVVTNHHVVLLDAEIRYERGEDFTTPAILPPYHYLIMDEAHHVEDEATELFSQRYSYELLSKTLDSLTVVQPQLKLNLLDFISTIDVRRKGFNREALMFIDFLKEKAKSFDCEIKKIFSSTETKNRSFLCDTIFYNNYRNLLIDNGEYIASEMRNLVNGIYSSDMELYVSEENKIYLTKIERIANELSNLSDTLLFFIRFSSFDTSISYISPDNNGYFVFNIAPLEVGSLIRSKILDQISSYLFCSATLSVDNKFDFFKERIGLTLNSSSSLINEGSYYSPFNYKKNLMYLIPEDGMEYNNNNLSSYTEYLAYSIENAILSAGGGALVLFTSINMMNDVFNIVKERIGDKIQLIKQDNRINKNLILKKFKENEDSSLFATSSFWEGIDVPGNTMRLLIITKLPFDVPTDPIIRARCNNIDNNDNGRSFIKLIVPNAIIKMKQGVGRLIRSEEDRGIVLILDNRMKTKGYGRKLYNSLPPGYMPEDVRLDNLSRLIENFLY